jgi:hypothetical protein
MSWRDRLAQPIEQITTPANAIPIETRGKESLSSVEALETESFEYPHLSAIRANSANSRGLRSDDAARADEHGERSAIIGHVGAEGHDQPNLIAPLPWHERVLSPGLTERPYDQPCQSRCGRIERAGAIFLHFCVTCGAWGSFGFGVTRDRPGFWYCYKHRPNEKPP